jgi:hypothetical protein
MSGRAATGCIGGRGCRRTPIIPRHTDNLCQRRGLARMKGFFTQTYRLNVRFIPQVLGDLHPT